MEDTESAFKGHLSTIIDNFIAGRWDEKQTTWQVGEELYRVHDYLVGLYISCPTIDTINLPYLSSGVIFSHL